MKVADVNKKLDWMIVIGLCFVLLICIVGGIQDHNLQEQIDENMRIVDGSCPEINSLVDPLREWTKECINYTITEKNNRNISGLCVKNCLGIDSLHAVGWYGNYTFYTTDEGYPTDVAIVPNTECIDNCTKYWNETKCVKWTLVTETP